MLYQSMAYIQYMHSKKPAISKGTVLLLLFFISKLQLCLQHGGKKTSIFIIILFKIHFIVSYNLVDNYVIAMSMFQLSTLRGV